MKLATLKKDTYFVDRYGEWVAVRAGRRWVDLDELSKEVEWLE